MRRQQARLRRLRLRLPRLRTRAQHVLALRHDVEAAEPQVRRQHGRLIDARDARREQAHALLLIFLERDRCGGGRGTRAKETCGHGDEVVKEELQVWSVIMMTLDKAGFADGKSACGDVSQLCAQGQEDEVIIHRSISSCHGQNRDQEEGHKEQKASV
jgi:hypothetical protein